MKTWMRTSKGLRFVAVVETKQCLLVPEEIRFSGSLGHTQHNEPIQDDFYCMEYSDGLIKSKCNVQCPFCERLC